MPKDTIEKAIMKGTGELGGDNFESMLYEGYGPGGVAIIIDGLTNNRSRTAPELRKIFEFNGGNLATSGSVAFQFTKLGVIAIKIDAVTEDRLMEVVLDAGADDVKNEGEVYEVLTSPVAFHKVKEALAAAKIPVEAGTVTFLPNTTIVVEGDNAKRVLKLLDELEDNDDVQSVSHNGDIAESVTV